MRKARGLTLIELIVVLAIMAAAVALVVPRFGAGSEAIALETATRQIAAGLRLARTRAVESGRDTSFVLDLKSARFIVTGDARERRLPDGLAFGLYTATSEQVNADQGGIRFFPDGSSTGGRVAVAAGAARRFVDVNWLTGRVAVLQTP